MFADPNVTVRIGLRGRVIAKAEARGYYLVRFDQGGDVTAYLPQHKLSDGGEYIISVGAPVLITCLIAMIGPGGTTTVEGIT